MSAHIHAALMAEYAKDVIETETPWEHVSPFDLAQRAAPA